MEFVAAPTTPRRLRASSVVGLLALACDPEGSAPGDDLGGAASKGDELGEGGDSCEAGRVIVAAKRVDQPGALELSGLVASRAAPGVLWAVNDAASDSRDFVVAFSEAGKAIAEFELGGADNLDWEDLSLGPGPDSDADYLYVADIGDNEKMRGFVRVWRVREPTVDPRKDVKGKVKKGSVEDLAFVYADDKARDAEALTVDPRTGDLYVIDKQRDADGSTHVFRASAPFVDGGLHILEPVLDSDDAEMLAGTVVGADIRSDGGAILLRYKDEDNRLWFRDGDEPIEATLARAGCTVPGVDKHVAPRERDRHIETIAFFADGRGYWMVPEGEKPPLFAVELAPG